MKPIISAEGLGKRYRILKGAKDARATPEPPSLLRRGPKLEQEDFLALEDVSFDIMPGERVGIIGPNGAGKSTLLKLLSRITEPTKGRITLRGRVASLLEVGTGFHPELTGRENIFLNGAILGMGRKEIVRKFDEIVDFAGVEEFLDVPVKRYSSGMYVRLGFAVAAHLEPEILVVDEVLAVGDTAFQKRCLGKMEEVSTGQGRTVLFVSHNMAMIASLCQRALLLRAGRMTLDGGTSDAILQYMGSADRAFSAQFVPLDGEYIGDEFAQLLGAMIENQEGRATSEFPITSPCAFSMSFAVRKANGRRLTPVFHVYRGDGAIAFSAFHPATPFAEGAHNVHCHIPANLLNDGGYSVSVGLLSFEPYSLCHFQVESALACTIVDSMHNTPTRGGYPRTIQGAVRPLLLWTHKELA